jgi:hypothetical protein
MDSKTLVFFINCSHASDSELDFADIKPMIVDAACFENSCLNNCVKPNSKDSGTHGKFVPIYHHCGKRFSQ